MVSSDKLINPGSNLIMMIDDNDDKKNKIKLVMKLIYIMSGNQDLQRL